MFNNKSIIKKYYNISGSTGGTGGTGSGGTNNTAINAITLLFITKSNVILNYYTTRNLLAFNTEIINFNNLKSQGAWYLW